jgi:ferric-dicitrate binding protein FerR (iron transport regulator)
MSEHCDRFVELSLTKADGRDPEGADLAFVEQHRAACPACRREAEALAALRMPASGPAHCPDSPAQRAKAIDRVLAALDAPDLAPASEGETDNVVPFTRKLKKPAMWAAGMVAAAAALLLVVRVGQIPNPSSGPAPLARVLLSSGEGLSAGMTVGEGQLLSAAGGEASLAVGNDIVLLLEPGSQAQLARLSRGAVEVALQTGRLHASVTPHTTGPRLAVTTADGRVEVTGTQFSVEALDGKSELKVLRGSVKVVAKGHRATSVEALHAQRLGADEIRAMSDKEQEGELSAMRRIGLLEAAEASMLQVRSSPSGARVSLDGEPIGATPLSAEVKTGHRHLVVATADVSREEWVDLHASDVPTIREFDLVPPPAVAVAEPESEPALPDVRHATLSRLPTKQLLDKAQMLRTRHDYSGSAVAYRELLTHKDAPVDALISYGDLLLENLGDPKGALKAYSRYPAWEGRADKAFAGRINAMHALGRKVDERAAIEQFLATFPYAPQRAAMERRLGALK